MAYYAGDPIVDTVYVEDNNGDPSAATADTVFVSATVTTPAGLTATPAISTGASAGLYVVTITTDFNLPGTYSVVLESAETGVTYLGSYDVDPHQPLAGVMFRDFRMAVAVELRDGIICTATQDSAGSVFYDDDNLTDGRNGYESSHAVCIASANADNVGKIRIVDSSSQVDSSITFAREFPATFIEGDTLHLFNLGGLGFRPQVYDVAIQQCIRDAYPDALIPTVVDGGTLFDSDSPAIAIPDDMVAIYAVSTLEEANQYRGLPSSRPGTFDAWGQGYAIDVARRQVLVRGIGFRDLMDGKGYRLYGYTTHRAPTDPTDVITIDTRWLTVAVKAKIAGRRVSSREWDSWAVEWGRMEGSERMRILTAREPNTIFLNP